MSKPLTSTISDQFYRFKRCKNSKCKNNASALISFLLEHLYYIPVYACKLLLCLPIGLLGEIYLASLTHQQTKNIDIHLPISDRRRGQRGANVGSGWGEKLRCHCRRLPSLCIWCTQLLHRQTEPDEYINTNKRGGRRPARNWIGIARPSNIGMRVTVGLIRAR